MSPLVRATKMDRYEPAPLSIEEAQPSQEESVDDGLKSDACGADPQGWVRAGLVGRHAGVGVD